VADLQLLVRCSRHKTPAAWLHTVAHRWDDTEMTQRWHRDETTLEQRRNNMETLGLQDVFHQICSSHVVFIFFQLRLYMYPINPNIDITYYSLILYVYIYICIMYLYDFYMFL
jgi:hypothetical protein